MVKWRVGAFALAGLWVATLGWVSPSTARPDPERSEAAAALPGAVARDSACDNAMVPAADVEASTRRLIGEIAALDEPGGKLLLRTRSGPVTLAASPETLSQLEVGDVVVVEVVPEPDAEVARVDCR